MIRKGDKVKIKPEWQDEGDDQFDWYAYSDQYGDRVQITCDIEGMVFRPLQTVLITWLEETE